jgi:copper chaperone CopZ
MSSGTLYCCDGLQKYELKVNMCCAKCAEKVKEEIFEVAGVMDVQTDVATSKVTVFGKVPDPFLVLKKAKKVNKKAEFISDPLAAGEQKKSELTNMAVKSDQKKSLDHHHHHNKSNNKSADQDSHLLLPTVGSEEFVDPSNSSSLSSTTYSNYYTTKPAMVAAAPPPYSSYNGMMPYYYAPHLYHQHHSPSTAAAAYRPSQSYPPNHYPQYLETDYSNYYPNPNYLTHIKSSY